MSILNTNDTIIAEELRKLLPEILIEYLWNLAEQETKDVDGALVECSLTAIEQDGKMVQQIDFFNRQHILTGFLPVCSNLYIIIYPDGNREMISAA